MVEVYRELLPSRDAAITWPGLINDLFGQTEVAIGDVLDFRGSITHARLGSLDLVDVASTREVSKRTARHIVRDNRDSFILVNVVRGSVRLQQSPHNIDMPAGSFTLYASGRPLLWSHDEHAEIRNVAIPGSMLRGRLRNVDRLLCRPNSDRIALWRLTSDFLISLAGQLRRLPGHAAHGIAGQLFELVTLALETDEDDLPLETGSVRAALRRKCDTYIRSRIADPSLDRETIAAAVGMSVRSLHRIFREADQTVGDFIREARLGAAHAMLTDPGKAHLSIAEIACRAGFRSQAHFANVFKDGYGLVAGECRRQAIGSQRRS